MPEHCSIGNSRHHPGEIRSPPAAVIVMAAGLMIVAASPAGRYLERSEVHLGSKSMPTGQ
jgi:hypothetical protein